MQKTTNKIIKSPEEQKEIYEESPLLIIEERNCSSGETVSSFKPKEGPSVLIADDQIFVLDLLKMLLSDLGVEADIALGG